MFEQIKNQFAAIVRDEEGAAMVEYILIVGLIALVAYVGYKALGDAINNKANAVATDPHLK